MLKNIHHGCLGGCPGSDENWCVAQLGWCHMDKRMEVLVGGHIR